jgi:hypothetical protein
MGTAILEPGGGVSAKVHHFRIGLFVLTGAALLIGALFAIGLKTYFGQRDVFETFVSGKVESLAVGALVKLRGVTIGKVSSIEFIGTEYPEYRQQFVLIHFEIPKGMVWGGDTANIQQMHQAQIPAILLRKNIPEIGNPPGVDHDF